MPRRHQQSGGRIAFPKVKVKVILATTNQSIGPVVWVGLQPAPTVFPYTQTLGLEGSCA